MYSNDTTQIRAGMVNYIGALISASKLPPKGARHDVVAILTEEALSIAKENDGFYDLYVLKPMLRANVHIYENKLKGIEEDMKILPREMRKELEDKKLLYLRMLNDTKELIKALDK